MKTPQMLVKSFLLEFNGLDGAGFLPINQVTGRKNIWWS
jgi:hypothetical protein